MFPGLFLLRMMRKGVTEMAATRLIALHANKGKTIARSLSDRTDYAKNPDKTEKGELVTGYQCDPFTVDEEFMLTKRKYEQITGRHQRRDVIAYQIRQSFKPGEITPEEANRLGRELALRFTKGKFAFIVATHTDRAHIHNHIVFNSTSLDGTRKFKNFWFSGLALQRLSDLVCLENSLSVIEAKPIGEREKRTEYPTRTSIRDFICRDIDRILQKKPKDFETVLFQLQQLGYEVKRGKHVSVKGGNQKRFVRLSSLPEGYREAEIRAAISGEAKREGRPHQKPEYSFNLLIDIQSKLQSKGKGFERWATVYNLKQMSKTVLFLRDNKIDTMEQLNAIVGEKVKERDRLLASIQVAEKRLKEIAALKTNIINYSKTRDAYIAYRKSGYSKKFYEAHRDEITLHKAAKETFSKFPKSKIPKVKDLNEEFNRMLLEKKEAYSEYKKMKKEMRDYQIAKQNVDMFYANEKNIRAEEEQKKKKQTQR